jgi:ABC-type multidrug transport system ATPase subunit
MLEVRGLICDYGAIRAVDGMAFDAPSGAIVCLVGPNGAGKSTTLRALAGLQPMRAGTIALDGRAVARDADTLRRAVALAPQDLALMDRLTAREALHVAAVLRDVPTAEVDSRVGYWLQVTDLTDMQLRPAHELSGGMKRRLAMAMVLIGEARVALLDESFVGLDPVQVRRMAAALRAWTASGRIAILSTHDMDLVARLADRVLVMKHGRVILHSPGEEGLHAVPGRWPDWTAAYLELFEGVTGPDRS